MKRLNYLAIPLAVLLTACQSLGGGEDLSSSDALPSADDVTSEAAGGFNLEGAAEKLGVSTDDLKSALGDKMDTAAAAEKLGISEATLVEALGSL